MDQATLVTPDIATGGQIIDVLDAAGIKVAVALFMLPAASEDWRLVLSSPALDQTETGKPYLQFVNAVGGKFHYTLPVIEILTMDDEFVREMRRLFGIARDVAGMRLGGHTLGGRYIEDAYVYRVQ